jgi:NitT/TauT family transport system ATP-binding protein
LLEIRFLRKAYDSDGRHTDVLANITLTVHEGQLVSVVGPAGCGKTTVSRCVGGLVRPSGGEVRVGGIPVNGPPDGLAMVFQEYGRSLFPWLRVYDNVELPLKAKRIERARRDELVREAVDAVGLIDAIQAWPWQLSAGMQLRVAIARALACEPRVLIMDEPFAAVDAQTRADLADLVRAVWQRFGVTVIVLTGDIDQAVYVGQRVAVLSSSPTVVLDDFDVDLPAERDQLTTRADDQFVELRGHIYSLIRRAKRAARAAR